MLVATPGQTTSFSTLHSNNSNGGGNNNTTAATTATKKTSTLNTINATASGAAKSLNNNKHAVSSGTSRTSLNSNAQSITYNYHQNPKNDNISNKINNQNKAAATSSRELISSNVTAAPNHSLKHENSTNTINTITTKQQSFIQTLKDSVQKALISTTGGSSNNSIANKYSTDNKLQINCNKSTTSTHNVISSSSSTSHNANKVSTTTSSNASSNLANATQSSSSVSGARSKYFSCSLSKLHTVAPTMIHRYPEERQNTSSADSLQKEMCHFKPIRIVPKTPWKSGSKSRGNSLRFPKANLATIKTEFVLKSNCDVNNRKKKQQQNKAQNDKINVADGDDVNEQENNEFHGIYKPKPSLTCLSTSITTPNHQSAFVCMIAQMKNLVKLQSKRQIKTAKSTGAVSTVTADEESLIDLFDRRRSSKRQQKEVAELPKIRSARLVSIAVKNKSVTNKTNSQTVRKKSVKQTNAKLNISKVSTVSLSKAKSRSKMGSAKSETIDFVALAAIKAKEKLQNSASIPAVSNNKMKTTSIGNTSGRKRKSTQDMNELQLQELSLSPSSTMKTVPIKSSSLGARKSSRLSTKNSIFKYSINVSSQPTISKAPQKPRRKLTSILCFSPPLTRSRHRHLTELGKLVTNEKTDVKKRKI